jgi:sigma-B regulation protein RsbU (phosphoserine phosphatase)
MLKRWSSVLVGIYFAVMLTGAGAVGYRALLSLAASDPGWRTNALDKKVSVISVRASGPAAAALREGDIILEINGVALRGPLHAAGMFEHLPPGTNYHVRVSRGDQILDFDLETGPIPLGLKALLPLASVIIPAIFFLTGLGVFLLRPDDKQSLLLALMFGTWSGLFIGDLTYAEFAPWLQAVIFLASICASFFWPIFFHFFLVFPDQSLSPVRRRFPRVEYLLYLPHVLLRIPYAAFLALLWMQSPNELVSLREQYSWIGYLYLVLATLYICGGLLSLLVNYREASRLLRRKMRVVVVGSILAILPMVILVCSELFFQGNQLSESVFLWFLVIAFSFFLFFPASLVYAIAKHQVIPIRLILRRGVRYVFVSRGSIIIEVITVGLALTIFLNYLFNRWSVSRPWMVLLSGLVAVVIWQITRNLHHRVIAPLIDRRFFRQAYNAQQVLSELGQALRGMPDLNEETFVRICEQIRMALNADNVVLFLRREATGDYECAVLSQHLEQENLTLSVTEALSFSSGDFIIKRLASAIKPLPVNFDDPHSWGRTLVTAEMMESSLREQTSEVLLQIRAALLLPIATKEGLIGVLSLGPRLGDLPYSREDEQLLMAVAWQLAYAIENAELVRRKAEEELFRREMEFATEVQMRLFPQSLPDLETLDLSGICYPARGIGGDYYDFLQLGPGQVGIAVADVSGKGLSAALLMSTVQASLRTQASFAKGRITELVASMNRLLCESTDMSHYATFFYAQYDEANKLLTYVNAGHNPPLLIRDKQRDTGRRRGVANMAIGDWEAGDRRVDVASTVKTVQLLETGGPVIGLLKDCEYRYESIPMQSGDVLIAYTDGVTEATNPEDEEFGESRLIDAVIADAHLRADEIVGSIVATVRHWCRETPQNDDLTLVVVKIR